MPYQHKSEEDHESPTAVFRKQLRKARATEGLTQAQLAGKLKKAGWADITQDKVNAIETARRGVSLDEAILISAALDIAPPHLFLPRDPGKNIRLAPKIKTDSWSALRWTRGLQRLKEATRETYERESPEARISAIGGLGGLRDFLWYVHLYVEAVTVAIESGKDEDFLKTEKDEPFGSIEDLRQFLITMIEGHQTLVEMGRIKRLSEQHPRRRA